MCDAEGRAFKGLLNWFNKGSIVDVLFCNKYKI